MFPYCMVCIFFVQWHGSASSITQAARRTGLYCVHRAPLGATVTGVEGDCLFFVQSVVWVMMFLGNF